MATFNWRGCDGIEKSSSRCSPPPVIMGSMADLFAEGVGERLFSPPMCPSQRIWLFGCTYKIEFRVEVAADDDE